MDVVCLLAPVQSFEDRPAAVVGFDLTSTDHNFEKYKQTLKNKYEHCWHNGVQRDYLQSNEDVQQFVSEHGTNDNSYIIFSSTYQASKQQWPENKKLTVIKPEQL